jgi:predicted nucleic acid-binding protein
MRMPDCRALLAAREHSATLAMFDDRLTRAAATLGISVISGTVG